MLVDEKHNFGNSVFARISRTNFCGDTVFVVVHSRIWGFVRLQIDRSTEGEALACIQKSEASGNSVPPIPLTINPDHRLTLDASFDTDYSTKPTIYSERP